MKVKLGNYISEYLVRNKFDNDISTNSATNTLSFCCNYFTKDVVIKNKTKQFVILEVLP